MRQKSNAAPVSSENLVRDIRRATRKHHAAEEKIRIVLDGLRGETSIAELFGKLEQSNFGTDDLLFSRHGVLQSPTRGASPPRPLRAPPRLAIRPGGTRTPHVRLSFS